MSTWSSSRSHRHRTAAFVFLRRHAHRAQERRAARGRIRGAGGRRCDAHPRWRRPLAAGARGRPASGSSAPCRTNGCPRTSPQRASSVSPASSSRSARPSSRPWPGPLRRRHQGRRPGGAGPRGRGRARRSARCRLNQTRAHGGSGLALSQPGGARRGEATTCAARRSGSKRSSSEPPASWSAERAEAAEAVPLSTHDPR